MVWIVEIGYKKDATDPVAYLMKKEIEDLGISGIEEVKSISTYAIDGQVTEEDVKKIAPFIDSVSFNFVGDNETIREVFDLEKTVDDFIESYLTIKNG